MKLANFTAREYKGGFGRYDVMLESKNREDDAASIIEFKVHAQGNSKAFSPI